MSPLDLFEELAPLVAPALEAEWGQRDLCILATAVVIDVATYWGIEVRPLPVQAVIYNAAFAAHVAEGDCDVRKWWPVDGSHSVGIGFGIDLKGGKWPGHLIAEAGGWFGDFSINQAERLDKDVVTGPAVVGPLPAEGSWAGLHSSGTKIEYRRHPDPGDWRKAPDWRNMARRRKLAGMLIREIKKNLKKKRHQHVDIACYCR